MVRFINVKFRLSGPSVCTFYNDLVDHLINNAFQNRETDKKPNKKKKKKKQK